MTFEQLIAYITDMKADDISDDDIAEALELFISDADPDEFSKLITKLTT